MGQTHFVKWEFWTKIWTKLKVLYGIWCFVSVYIAYPIPLHPTLTLLFISVTKPKVVISGPL